MSQKRQLPELADLHLDLDQAFKNDEFKTLLNQPPSNSWIKKHPLAKTKNSTGQNVPAEYLPIDKVEFMLDVIFQEWRIEVLSAAPMFQSIAVTVRVHYKNPVTGEWSFHDGVGAKSVQVNSGANASDLGAIKDAAVQMALPSAKSYALKDACQHLGKLFGRDLNRNDTIEFAGKYGPGDPDEHQSMTVDTAPPYGKVQSTPPSDLGAWAANQNMWSSAPAPAPSNDSIRTQMYKDSHPKPQSINLNAL